MPVVRPDSAAVHEAHGSTFTSYVRPGTGSSQLCAWRLEVPPHSRGVPHRPTREEVLLVLSGRLALTLDGETADLVAGEVAFVPAGSELRVDTGADGAGVWVTSTPGLQAQLPDGAVLTPPWAS